MTMGSTPYTAPCSSRMASLNLSLPWVASKSPSKFPAITSDLITRWRGWHSGSLPQRCGMCVLLPRRSYLTCACSRVVRRGRRTGSPRSQKVSRRGPPRCLGRPLRVCPARPPRRRRPSPRPPDGEIVIALPVIPHPCYPGRLEVAGPHGPWPTRSRADASLAPLLRPSPGSLPA